MNEFEIDAEAKQLAGSHSAYGLLRKLSDSERQRKQLKIERDALAAHVEWLEGLRVNVMQAIGDDNLDILDLSFYRDDMQPPAPATSLARRDAELLNRPFEGLPGCTDGGCVVKKPEGMHTNGGCQCIKHQTASTIVQRLARLRDQFRQQAEGGGDE
ncbi:MAG: hypothetical protein Unbinned4052contig1001_25 [Prokaryotic dsDNA virus sp.]|nr:MAG: hypothetical protein Unbinned4052contig1001_25 [Prokaryotic dsDNA virus sp.]